jgi:hypothetical protein
MALDAASLSAFCSSPLSFSRLAWKLSARRKAMGLLFRSRMKPWSWRGHGMVIGDSQQAAAQLSCR